MKRRKLTGLQQKAFEFIKERGEIVGVDLDKHLFTPGTGNVYSLLKTLTKKGYVERTGMYYRVALPPKRTLTEQDFALVKKVALMNRTAKIKSHAKRLKEIYSETKREVPQSNQYQAKTNSLIPIIQNEIRYIESGIDSLMITKSYLERRVEQLEKGLA